MKKKTSAKIVRTAANAANATECGPPPRIIGIGPIRMIAPPLAPLMFESEPKAISNMPMKMAAKAMKNSQVTMENCEGDGGLCTAAGPSFAWQLEQDQRIGSMQLLQTVLPQSWQT